MSLWKTVPFWTVARRVERTGVPDARLLSVYRDWGVVPKDSRDDNFNRASEDLSNYKIVHPGDLVLNKMKTWQGSLGVSDYNGIVSPAYFVCELGPSVNGRYLHHLLRSQAMIAAFRANSKGIRPNQWDLPYEVLHDIPLPMPPLEEQRRIADFLDDRVARIDKIIAARQQQAELAVALNSASLESEVRRLTETRGYAPMRRFGFRIEQGWSPEADSIPAEDGELGILKLGAVRAGTFDPSQNKKMLAEMHPRDEFALHRGDLLITRANTPSLVGDVAWVDQDFPNLYLSDLIYRVRLQRFDHAAACAALRTQQIRQEIGVIARGTSSSMPKLRGEDIASLPLPLATAAEQRGLAALDANIRGAQESQVSLLQAQIIRWQEYKQSLITAAVTGEFDVTIASTKIPE